MHLDLSETGLSFNMALMICKAVKRSRSLLSIHLSGNPGLSPAFTSKVTQKLGATYETPLNIQSFG